MNLQDAIVDEMVRHEGIEKNRWPGFRRESYAWYCTWWFAMRIPTTTAIIRRELKKMEKAGVVIANRSQRNNTQWMLCSESVEVER